MVLCANLQYWVLGPSEFERVSAKRGRGVVPTGPSGYIVQKPDSERSGSVWGSWQGSYDTRDPEPGFLRQAPTSAFSDPEGPSSQHFRFPIPTSIPSVFFGTRTPQMLGTVGASGQYSQYSYSFRYLKYTSKLCVIGNDLGG